MRDLESRIRAVVRRRTPKGWTVHECKDGWPWQGTADPKHKRINCPPLVDRYGLLVFLHECGHVELGHWDDPTIPIWREEYEAEQYAVKAARAEGIAVPEGYIGISRHEIRCHCEKALQKDPDCEIDDEVLKFAFPDSWKTVRDGEPLRKAA